VAANGPKTIALAGEFGDGCVTTGVTNPERLEAVKKHLQAGAAQAKRKLPEKFPIITLTHVCVLQPGEDLDSPRVKTMCGPWVMANLHAFAAGYARAESLPAPVRPVFQAYMDYVSKMKTPRDERYLELHSGHCCYVEPAEWKFVTPESIECCTIVGPREKVVEQIRGLEKAGLSQIFLNPPMDGFGDCIGEIAREVFDRV
jgi:alkanesulfonate monooxygenase SsuD/methylene tetrahydromethanopterin reductase-like flavin-dependent oxidoreductase (luciferase family)